MRNRMNQSLMLKFETDVIPDLFLLLLFCKNLYLFAASIQLNLEKMMRCDDEEDILKRRNGSQ